MGTETRQPATDSRAGRMHFSRPSALRFLAAIRRLGWKGTTRDLAQVSRDMGWEMLNVHSEAANARRLLEDLGVPDPPAALWAQHLRTSERGRRIQSYYMRADAIEVARQVLDGATTVQASLF